MRQLLVIVFLLTGAVAAQVGIQVVRETGHEGVTFERYVVFTGSEYLALEEPASEPPVLPSDTGMLWVDRNHRYAIIQSLTIQGDGMGIFGYWDLNNQRAAYYRTLGTNTPTWESPGIYVYSYGGHQIGASQRGEALALAAADKMNRWSKLSGVPSWTRYQVPPGFAVAKTSYSGTKVARATVAGILTVFDAENGDSLWSVQFNEGSRLQGIALSNDGAIVAVTVYDSCFVFENGVRRGAVPIGVSNAGTQYAAKLSGDGKYLVTGDYQGRVKLWRWSGSIYELMWSATVGTPWVTDVNISNDGSTIAAGTGYANGRAVVFDSSSSAPLWSYQNYGGYGGQISSCALAHDGSRVVFASWGDTAQSGTSYVMTVQARNDPEPICGITRNEEVGSLFACDISGDGQYVTAGGKAVHAYRMGNGGQVYSFLIGHTPANNVGVIGIQSPGAYLQLGSPVSPIATVRNFGDSTVSFVTHLAIKNRSGVLHQDSVLVTGLAPQTGRQISFSSWTPTAYEFYDFVFWTALPGDEQPFDDTLIRATKCFHDARAGTVAPPFPLMTVGYRFVPRCKVYNSGSYADVVFAGLLIRDSSGAAIYADSTSWGPIAPGDSAVVRFAPWEAPYAGRFVAAGYAHTSEDFVPGNDTVQQEFEGTWEIVYDDGVADAYYWVGRRDNDKFYVRMVPTATPPFTITGGRIWVNMANQPFAYVAVCKDNAGIPDTTQELQRVENIVTPVAPAWITFDLDIPRMDNEPIWLIARWADGTQAIGIGADANAPIDSHSYYSSNQDPFTLWWRHDWMMRLRQEPMPSGLTERFADTGLKFALGPTEPNPFRNRALFHYSLAEETYVRLLVFDAHGRLVGKLAEGRQAAGRYRVEWNGKDGRGRELPAGVYFCRLRIEPQGFSAVRKLMLTR